MTDSQRTLLTGFLDEVKSEYTMYDGYSGRGMYGRETNGIVLDSSADIGYLSVLAKVNEFTIAHDSLGLRFIVY